MIRDQMFNVQWAYVKRVGQQWLDAMDRTRMTIPGQVVLGIAVTFLMICKRYELNPREALDVADRVIRKGWDLDHRYLRGMRDYFKEELPDA